MERDEEPLEIMPANWEATQTFVRCQTQWRVGMAGPTGLDYPAVETVMRLLGVEDPADCFDRLQIIEAESLRIYADRRAADRA